MAVAAGGGLGLFAAFSHPPTTNNQQHSVAILAQVATVGERQVSRPTMFSMVWFILFWVPGAVSGAQDPNSMAHYLPGTPSFPEEFAYMEESSPLPPLLLPRFAFADPAAFFSAFLPRRLLSLRLGAGTGRFLRSTSWPCLLVLVRLLCAALSAMTGCLAATAWDVPAMRAVS